MKTIFAFNKEENVYAKLTQLENENFEFELLLPNAKEPKKITICNDRDNNDIKSKEFDWFRKILIATMGKDYEGWEIIDKQRYNNIRTTMWI